MMFVVVQKMIHVQDVDGVDGVVGEDVIEVAALALVSQDSALVRDGRVQVDNTFDGFGVD